MVVYKINNICFIIFTIACILFVGGSPEAATRTQIKKIIIEESSNSMVPPSLALAVAKIESDFNAKALSTAGARGVMQIMPKTARDEFGVDRDELWNARLNVQLGIDYLERLYDLYGGKWNLALSHYNGGSLKKSGPHAHPHGYTRKYVADVLKWRARYGEQARVWQAVSKNILDDNWTPARTKVRLRASNISKFTSVTQNVRSIKNKSKVKVRLNFSNVRKKIWKGDPDFLERLRRARLTLDDFAPIIRWTEEKI